MSEVINTVVFGGMARTGGGVVAKDDDVSGNVQLEVLPSGYAMHGDSFSFAIAPMFTAGTVMDPVTKGLVASVGGGVELRGAPLFGENKTPYLVPHVSIGGVHAFSERQESLFRVNAGVDIPLLPWLAFDDGSGITTGLGLSVNYTNTGGEHGVFFGLSGGFDVAEFLTKFKFI